MRRRGPLRSVENTLARLEVEAPALAILDVNLGHGKTSISIAKRLSEMNIPFVFLTGYDPVRYDNNTTAPNAPQLSKPLDEHEFRGLLIEIAQPS